MCTNRVHATPCTACPRTGRERVTVGGLPDGDAAEIVPHCVGQGLAPDEDCHWYLRVLEFCDVCGCVCTHAARRANCHPFSCTQHKVVPQRSNFLTLMSACPGINWTVPVTDHPRSQQQNLQATVISSGCLVRPSHTHDYTYFIATAACLSLPRIVH